MPKACLLDRDGNQSIGHVIRNSKTVLNAEVINEEDVIALNQVRATTWIKSSKEYDYEDAFNSDGCDRSYFEPIVLIFNTNDCLNNFCLFSNRRVKGHNHESEGLSLDTSHSS